MGKVLAAYVGGFKPPTAGHFEFVKNALQEFPEIDEFFIYVGGKVRDGIDQFEAIQIWDIYKKYLANKVDIQPSKSPIGDILRLAKDNPQDFLETVNDPMLNLYGDVVQFFNNTWLVLKNQGKDVYFNLPKNKNKLLSVPFGEDHYYIVASFFQGDDGVETYKLLSKKLKKDK